MIKLPGENRLSDLQVFAMAITSFWGNFREHYPNEIMVTEHSGWWFLEHSLQYFKTKFKKHKTKIFIDFDL